MKYCLLALLMLASCGTDGLFAVARQANKPRKGTMICEGTAPMKFVGRVWYAGSWVEFTTDDGQKIATSFPCAVLYDKE